MKHSNEVKQIVQNIGGKDNVNNAWHCMTRLRFDLKDEKQVNYDEVNKIPGVIGSTYKNGQLQIVIGTTVNDWFQTLSKELGLEGKAQDEQPKEKKGIVSLFMDTVSGVFGPIVPAIAGAGMLKGLMSGMAAQNLISNTSDTYVVLDMLASGVFTFLPFFVAASAAKIFKTNQYLAMAIAAAMVFPTMTAAAAAKEITAYNLFGFLPVPVFSYTGSIIPIILAVLALSYIWRFVDNKLPEIMRTVFTPTISLFVTGIVSFVVIGPIGIYLGNLLADGIQALFDISPIFAGVIVGAIRPVAILTGLHHAMTPIALQNFEILGYDMLMPMMFMANMAITGAAAAIYFKVNTKAEKSIIFSSAFSGLLGITEPALFGVLTKYKKAFIAATIGSSISSAFIAFFGVRLYGYILSSVFSLPAYSGQYFVYCILGVLIALASSFAIATVLVPKEAADESLAEEVELFAVTNGEYISLEDVNDDVFSTKMVGDGFAMTSEDGQVYAPIAGRVSAVFPTKHAIGITNEKGVEVLVHMGIDTVALDGNGFDVHVSEGDHVTKDSKIATMDLDHVKSEGKDDSIIVLITNMHLIDKLTGEFKVGKGMKAGDRVEKAILV